MHLLDSFFRQVAVVVLFASTIVAAAAAQSALSESWERLREMNLEQVRSLTQENDSPRHHLWLALLEIDDDVSAAAAHLAKAAASAAPGSDEGRLAAMLECSFAELLGSPLEYTECDRRGQSIGEVHHPLPAAIGQIHYGIWLAINGQYSASFEAHRLAEELALAAGDWRLAASTQNNLGVDYLSRGLPVQALRKFQAAVEQIETSGAPENESFLTTLTSNIASTHLELGDFETADSLLQDLTNSSSYDRNNPTNLMDEAILAKASLALNRPEAGRERLRGVLDAVGSYGGTGYPGLRPHRTG